MGEPPFTAHLNGSSNRPPLTPRPLLTMRPLVMPPHSEPWLPAHLPAPLLVSGPLGLAYWQWIALPALAVVALAVGYLLERVTLFGLRRLARRTRAGWDDMLVERLGGPLWLAWAVGTFFVVLPALNLVPAAHVMAERLLRVGLLIGFFWILWRLVTVLGQLVGTSSWATLHPASRSLVPLAGRGGKILVVAVAVVAVLAELGYPVASLIAGLGIGGLAVALAAQKTFENVFGAFAIGLDQPFREGDYIGVDTVQGTVEAIGLRSTRIRTLDRTIVSIPNGKLADARVESFAARDRIRFTCDVRLGYSVTAAQVRAVVAGIDALLRAHPKIWPDPAVRLEKLGDSSIEVDVLAWFATTDWNEFTVIRQEMLLGIMDVVEKAGTALAYPTQTVQVVGPGSGPRPGA